MPKYVAVVAIGAGVGMEIEAETPEEAAELAMDHERSMPTLCHQCSNDLDLGDPMGVLVDLDGEEVFNSFPQDVLRKELEEVKAERDDLAAQVADMRGYIEEAHDLFVGLSEYWNGSEGLAAEDAAQHASDEASKMLDKKPDADERPQTSLATLIAEQQKIGAASFRHEIMESVKAPFRPHIQGVFEAWLRRQAGGDA